MRSIASQEAMGVEKKDKRMRGWHFNSFLHVDNVVCSVKYVWYQLTWRMMKDIATMARAY